MTPEKLTRPHESKPWNPIIASVFYRAGIIEKWGMGTLNIIEWCKENGNPKPMWEVRAQSVITTFLPSSFLVQKQDLEIDVLRPESRPESLAQIVLDLLQKCPLSKTEIAKAIGHKNISGRLKKVLVFLLKGGSISYILPDKPKSRLQKYQIEKRPESRPESLEAIVLNLLQRYPMSKAELAKDLGHVHISGRLKKVLVALLKEGKIAYTGSS